MTYIPTRYPPSQAYPPTGGLPTPGTPMPPTYTGPYPTYADAWWDRALGWLGQKLGMGNVASEDVFWGAAKTGTVMCSGPFTVSQVADLLDRATPEQVERAKMSIQARSWYRRYTPANNYELAGLLVAEAHGGRDCSPSDWPSQAAAQAIRALAAEAPPDAADMLDGGATEARLPILAAIGLGLYFLTRPAD